MDKRRLGAADAHVRCGLNGLLVVPALLLAGCGPSGPTTYPVRGTVTFNGQNVLDGYITFSPTDVSQAPDAGPIHDGRFAFRAMAGPKRVEIQASRFVGPENPIMGLRPREPYIPERYNIESTLEAEVTPNGENEFEFELFDETFQGSL